MTQSLTLSALYVYPIKSAGGIALAHSDIGPRGLTHDRRWMVVGAAGRPVTQREAPKLRLLDVSFEDGGLRVAAPHQEALHIPWQPQGAPRTVDMWGTPLACVSVSAQAASWLSTFLGGDYDLVYLPGATERWQPESRPFGSQLSFVDGSPFHLISEVSIADLNGQLELPVGHTEFRPNLVISGGAAYQEDVWRRIRVGEVAFEVVESCARCSILNVNASGQMTAQPLRTLSRLRRRGEAVLFGQQLVQDAPHAQRSGQLAVGDVLEVLEVGQTANPVYL